MDRINKTENLFWEKFGTNTTCQSCQKTCKQHAGVELVSCKMFQSNGGKKMKKEPTKMKASEFVDMVSNKSKRTRAKEFIFTDVETDQKVTTPSAARYIRESDEMQEIIYNRLMNTVNTKKFFVDYLVEKIEEDGENKFVVTDKKTGEKVTIANSKVKSWMRENKEFQHKMYKKALYTINSDKQFLDRWIVNKIM